MAHRKKTRKRVNKKHNKLVPVFLLCMLVLLSSSVVLAGEYAKANQSATVVLNEVDPNFHIKNKVIAFFEDNNASEMIPIIQCESNFRHYNEDGDVLRNRSGSNAIGVAQIMSSVHPDPKIIKRYNKRFDMDITIDTFDVNTFEGNLGYALVLYKVNGVRDWECSKKFRW